MKKDWSQNITILTNLNSLFRSLSSILTICSQYTGLPTKDGFHRRLYSLTLSAYLNSWFSVTYKLLSFFALSLNRLYKSYINDIILNLTLKTSYLVSFRSSLQSHNLGATLYNNRKLSKITIVIMNYDVKSVCFSLKF